MSLETLKSEITATNLRITQLLADHKPAEISKLYTVDAKFLVAGRPTYDGNDAIRRVWEYLSGMGGYREVKTDEIFCETDASAIEIGKFERKDNAGAVIDHGKYMVVWKRVNGVLRIHREMLQSDLPTPAQP